MGTAVARAKLIGAVATHILGLLGPGDVCDILAPFV